MSTTYLSINKNNLKAMDRAIRRTTSSMKLSYYVETQEPMCFPGDDCDCDGKNLADALGIDYVPLEHILNCDATDYTESIAMNTRPVPSTLGYYLRHHAPAGAQRSRPG